MEAYTVYINYSEKFDKYYIGQTQNFKSRLTLHNQGLVKDTQTIKFIMLSLTKQSVLLYQLFVPTIRTKKKLKPNFLFVRMYNSLSLIRLSLRTGKSTCLHQLFRDHNQNSGKRAITSH